MNDESTGSVSTQRFMAVVGERDRLDEHVKSLAAENVRLKELLAIKDEEVRVLEEQVRDNDAFLPFLDTWNEFRSSLAGLFESEPWQEFIGVLEEANELHQRSANGETPASS